MAKTIKNFFKAKAYKEDTHKVVYEKKQTGIPGIFSIVSWREVNRNKIGTEYHLKISKSLEDFDRIYVNGDEVEFKIKDK